MYDVVWLWAASIDSLPLKVFYYNSITNVFQVGKDAKTPKIKQDVVDLHMGFLN